MPLARIRRIQDSVHGLMEFRDMETVVIELLRTPELRRLRDIKQMGLADHVFPGAEHSRFVHSLGAAYVAIRFGHQLREVTAEHLSPLLRPDDWSIRDLAVAALCHDIGHGPLSHQWEREVIGEDFDRAAWGDSLGVAPVDMERLKTAKWHEIVGFALLGWESKDDAEGSLHRLLEQHEEGLSRRIQEMLLGDYYIPFLPQLLDGDVDVDRADFILRDARQAGVGYGLYDLEWLISTSTVGFTEQGNRLVVGFDERKAVRVVEQFLLARRAQYDTVYQHKTIRSAEGMVALFLRRLKHLATDGVPLTPVPEALRAVLTGNTLTLGQVIALDDSVVWTAVRGVASARGFDNTAVDLAQRLLSRDLFKMVACESERLGEFRENAAREAIPEAIKAFCPGDPNYYFHFDVSELAMLSGEPKKWAYFVDSCHCARPIHEHEALSVHQLYEGRVDGHRRVHNRTRRLFTLREARPALEALLN